MTSIIYRKLFLFTLFFSTLFSSCKKLVEIEPPVGSISQDNIFTNNSTAIAALAGIYKEMINGTTVSFTGSSSISFWAGMSADEFTLFSGISTERENAYYKNRLSAIDVPVIGSEHWSYLYNMVYRCNAAIEGLTHTSAEALTPSVRQQLLGEAKFLRAFFYFYLVNMYGNVPLVVQTDPAINVILPRSPKAAVYDLIVNDLLDAKEKLSPEYLAATLSGSSIERVRPTRWAATALLSRAYLYLDQHEKAEIQATELITNTAKFQIEALNSVFVKTSREAIWQLQPIDQFFNTRDARLFVITSMGPNNSQPVYLSPQLLTSFENGDNRQTDGNWVNSRTVGSVTYRYPFKYKLFAQDTLIKPASGTMFMGEFLTVFRLGEQYLIRAEARIRQNRIAEGINDVNVLRSRARGPLPGDLPDLPASLSQNDALTAVLHERQVELFSEWGHRWFDLKRTGKVDQVMTVVTPLKSQGLSQWQSYQQLYPIPQTDIDKAPNLQQNPGY